jgi:hypothetical protein
VTAPSAMVDAVVTGLSDALGSEITVRKHSGKFGADGKEWTTVRTPGILVTSVGAPTIDDAVYPPVATLQMVAFCIVKLPKDGDSETDVASDMAATVSVLALNRNWGVGYKTGLRASFRNEYTDKLSDKGLTIWSVTWQQPIELDPESAQVALLQRLSRIRFSFVAGVKDVPGNATDNDADDIEAQSELTGATPPTGNT